MIDKRTMRRDLRAARRAFVESLDPGERTAFAAALRDVALSRLPAGGVVGAYAAVGDEIDAAPIVNALGAERVALPWFADRDAPMAFRISSGRLERGPFAVPQPTADAAPALPDLLLVPLVGADLACRRIGQGAGHYDRYLAENRVATIGLAWDIQIVDELPSDPWDVPLDAVATPTRWIVARGDGSSRLR